MTNHDDVLIHLTTENGCYAPDELLQHLLDEDHRIKNEIEIEDKLH